MKKSNYEQILNFLDQNKIDRTQAFVATSCDCAYANGNKKFRKKFSYDAFCSACYDLWLDGEDHTSITYIADLVVEYAEKNGELPTEYCDIANDMDLF